MFQLYLCCLLCLVAAAPAPPLDTVQTRHHDDVADNGVEMVADTAGAGAGDISEHPAIEDGGDDDDDDEFISSDLDQNDIAEQLSELADDSGEHQV